MTVFREAEPGDFDQIMGLYRQLQPADPVLEDGTDAAVFKQILDSTGLRLFALEDSGTIVATAYLNVIPNLTRSAAPYAVIENAATLQAAWGTGCYKAMLMTGSRNPATHGFYRACGFSADAKTGYVARPS